MQRHKEIQNIPSLKLFLETGSQADLNRVADFFPALVYFYDTEKKKISSFNRKFEQLLQMSAEDLSEKYDNDLLNLIHPEDREFVKSEISKYKFLKDDDTLSYTARFKSGDDEWKFFRTEGMVFSRNEKGNASSFVFVGQDISNELKGSEELDASRNFFRETEKLLQFGSWRFDPKTDTLDWSDGMYALLEYDEQPSEVSLSTYANHIPDAERQKVLDFMLTSMQTKDEFEITYTIRTAHGNNRIVHSKANCIRNEEGELIKILGVTRDITQQSKDHKDLLDYKQAMLSKERFLASGSWEYDLLNNALSWSEGKYRLFGYDPDKPEALPVITDELFASHVQHPAWKGLKDKWDLILSHPDEHIWEYEIRTAQGERKVLESYANIIRDSVGNPERIIGATRDITRIREYEESLQRKITELDRSNKELEEFAYIASHDLQEPLRKITAFSERLKEKAATELSPESNVYLDRMLVGASNMRLLIDNLLEFSRTSRHSHPFIKVNLGDVLKEVESDLELKIDETNAGITSNSMPVVEAIPSQIRQLFTNLLVNSIKFRQKDIAPEITIHSEKLTASQAEHYELERDQTYFKIEFKDNGIGFEQEYSTRIFQIFQRLHGKSEYPGSGIGLAICKKIADNHHGKIFAVSEINKGATFTIILPESQS